MPGRQHHPLLESEQRLRAIYDGTYEYIGVLSRDGTLLEANRASLEFAAGTTREGAGAADASPSPRAAEPTIRPPATAAVVTRRATDTIAGILREKRVARPGTVGAGRESDAGINDATRPW